MARFSGISLLGIVTLHHGFFSMEIPFSSSLKSFIAALYTSLIQTGYYSLQRLVPESESIQRLRNADVKLENNMLSVCANLSM